MGSSGLGKAATLDELLSTCIEMFDDNGELNNSYLPRIVLLMHRWYLSSTELAEKLLCIYRNASGESCDEFRLKICYFMRYWIVKFPAEFNLDLGLIRMTEEFREVASQLGYEKHTSLIDISSIPSYDWMRRVTQRKKVSKKGKACLLFDHLEPIELAEHLTFLEHKSFRRISFTDYQSYVIHGCLENNPTLERSIALFNGISKWVQLMVLSKPTPQQRAEVITKFINVAKKLLQLKNFNTLMAVVGGLSHSSISRLKETHSHLSSEVTKNWNEMTELVSSNGNYCNYRKAFADCDGFKIPILGVHLKDLIAVHVIFPDWTEENKVNIVKMHQLSVTLSELVSLQNASHHLEPNLDLINLLTLSLDLYHTEDDIYKLSLVLEPRNSKSQPTSPTTPTKPVVPLEWASGVMPKPDPTVINKHIRKLVESVFRNYDHDHDGYISQEDFESIAANFPFLDSFCVLDKDQDGLISKDEMMAYFLRAKSQLHCKMGPGFVHNFQEMTYLKPTFCEHCAGFLWGIIKQGYKCKDCGANCHKQCKDLLVLACRRFARAPSLGSSHGSLPGSPSLPPVQDEVFEFPGVTAGHRDLDSRAITLVTGSSGKISVRLQRATTSQATQTEPVWSEAGWGDSGSHTFPKMKSKFHDKAAKDKGFAKWENEKPRVQAGVDVVDRGTTFEPDRDEADMDETKQDGEDG
ncbi:ras guanyl-releasing protein 3 isoform X1 [Cervus canadensis]|uniref:ras guanyl-releasing protein 3 isoform X1 n=1 Tax=Cervus canadensis TaxID=1574408 RepID=UPI001C9E79CE|nr:ras guanyl-releasing protein 3 isoform X1 [Cervus canadensis]XP_043324240.1 ras guanyl-releasing protein 3 isoform X1 [Cervus canadensis]XP_043324242.1 ras guanyl-releasing protein 3 isoform X1 [Cervus canadensis]XP_043324243.1 ras guanyl-releasing protein 3 isoform X1 [Cervus canadensis]XP_043324244.1 ras guanyl-releasing protein 3 isoform X1 [Cervus canadensis]XP_043324245.1 ras guanyl-releasing protein 3 isoform X1 [Cervus canadensis]XP_043324246.1 ras guanyl-releasing protein 3 isoform